MYVRHTSGASASTCRREFPQGLELNHRIPQDTPNPVEYYRGLSEIAAPISESFFLFWSSLWRGFPGNSSRWYLTLKGYRTKEGVVDMSMG